MSVVNADARDPAAWRKAPVSYGVVKDGEILRFCRMGRRGGVESFSCDTQTWQTCPPFRKRLEADQAAGAWLMAGLEPHRVMIRSLTSPLRDETKSSEIWGTLLDAALPFPLEKCQVCFLPDELAGPEGRRCLAVAARLTDLEEAQAEWRALGLEPDALLPEPLMISKDRHCSRWLGGTRSVFALWRDGTYLGGGGSLDPAQRDMGFARFCHSLPDAEALTCRICGPSVTEEPEALEKALAMAGRRPHPLHANLLARPLSAPALQKRYAQKQQTLKVALLLLLMLLFLFPLTLRYQLRVTQDGLRRQIAADYEALTGRPGNAPGQELLLARRYLEDQRGPLSRAVTELSGPGTANTLVEILQTAAAEGLVFSDLSLNPSRLKLHLIGEASGVEKFCETLRMSGWRIQRQADSNGTWQVQGERL